MDLSDRLAIARPATETRPVRLPRRTGQTNANCDRQHMPPIFFGKACLPKKQTFGPKLSEDDD